MAEPEVTGSKDLLRSFYYLYDKSPSFREIISDAQWQKRRISKIEMVWVEGPTYRDYYPNKPPPFVATSRLVGEDSNRTWRIEFNRHLMGKINENPESEGLDRHGRPMKLEEMIAHEVAHFLVPAATVGAMIAGTNEREYAVVHMVNGIRRDLRLRQRRLTDPDDLKHNYQRAYHYNEEWDDERYNEEQNIHRTTGWRAHLKLAPDNYRTGPLGDGSTTHSLSDKTVDKQFDVAEQRVQSPGSFQSAEPQSTAGNQPDIQKVKRAPLPLDPTVHRLMSGDLSALDPENRPFSPNLLRMLMGGRAHRVKGATRLHDIARPQGNRFER